MIIFLLQVFLKPVIEDRNMELARKCSELISDVSDGDCVHPYICISLFKWLYVYDMQFFLKIGSVQQEPTQGSKSTQRITKVQSSLG